MKKILISVLILINASVFAQQNETDKIQASYTNAEIDQKLQQQQKKLQQQQTELQQQQKKLQQQQAAMQSQQEKLQQQDETINELKNEVNAHEKRINSQEELVNRQNEQINKQEKGISMLKYTILGAFAVIIIFLFFINRIAQKNKNKIEKLNAENHEKSENIKELTDKLQSLKIETNLLIEKFNEKSEKNENINSANVYFLLGLNAGDKNELENAIKHYNNAIKLNPDLAVAYYNISRLHSLHGNKNAAFERLEKSFEKGLYKNMQRISVESEKDFDNIKNELKFKELLDKYCK
jgi:peptidoglycan hydrolase CwlO-like protein